MPQWNRVSRISFSQQGTKSYFSFCRINMSKLWWNFKIQEYMSTTCVSWSLPSQMKASKYSCVKTDPWEVVWIGKASLYFQLLQPSLPQHISLMTSWRYYVKFNVVNSWLTKQKQPIWNFFAIPCLTEEYNIYKRSNLTLRLSHCQEYMELISKI